MNISLNCLNRGEKGRVITISPACPIKRRLQDLGVLEKTTIECITPAPGGDPVAYLICGAMIALRNKDSSNIIVQKL